MADEKIKLNTTEASGGSRAGVVRIVLAVSLTLVVIAFVAIYIYYG